MPEALILAQLKSHTKSHLWGMTVLVNSINPVSDTAYSKLPLVDAVIYTYKNAILLLVSFP